jgi:hypothetical protein
MAGPGAPAPSAAAVAAEAGRLVDGGPDRAALEALVRGDAVLAVDDLVAGSSPCARQ